MKTHWPKQEMNKKTFLGQSQSQKLLVYFSIRNNQNKQAFVI